MSTPSSLRIYSHRLSNLSSANRTIFLPHLRSKRYIDLYHLNNLHNKNAFTIVESLIKKKKQAICAIVDSRMAASNEMSLKISRLKKIEALIYEEQGTRDLHVGWPYIHGKFIGGNYIRCPLLYIPVQLVLEKNLWMLQTREDEDITFNKSFLLAYASYHKIAVNDKLLEENFEDIEKNSLAFRTALYQILEKSNIDIHFNADNYSNRLQPFVYYTKQSFGKNHEEGKMKLFPEAVLGILPQAHSHLTSDYDFLIKKNESTRIEDLFIKKNVISENSSDETDYPSFTSVKEEELPSGYIQDEWQEKIIKKIRRGHSLIVDGPPGSGKSHLICNIICDSIATGKKTLVVCQKKAALDVVYHRLSKLGLSSFVALVHDFRSERKKTYEKIAQQIESIEEFITKNNSIDTIQLERKFFRVCRRIDQIVEELRIFKNALFKDLPQGISVKELYLRSNPSAKSIPLHEEAKLFSMDTLDIFLPKLEAYIQYAKKFEHNTYPWLHRKSFASLRLSDAKEIEKLLHLIPQSIKNTVEKINQLIGSKLTWTACEQLWEQQVLIIEMLTLLEDEHIHNGLQQIMEAAPSKKDLSSFNAIKKDIAICCTTRNIETHTPTEQLTALQDLLTKTKRAEKTWVGKLYKKIFISNQAWLKKILFHHHLSYDAKGFESLTQHIQSRLHIETMLHAIKKIRWVSSPPQVKDIATIIVWIQKQDKILRAYQLFLIINKSIGQAIPKDSNMHLFHQTWRETHRLLSSHFNNEKAWTAWLGEKMLATLISYPKQSDLLKKTLQEDFDALCEFDRIVEKMMPVEKSITSKAYQAIKEWDYKNIKETCINSMFLAWIEDAEMRNPILQMVSSGKIKLLESELEKLVLTKQQIGETMTLIRARETVVDNITHNRIGNRTTYRDLHHQLTKKRRIWPMRKLVNTHLAEMLQLIPSWLASPETVSAIFPMKEMFDIVIFDEASQCFAEHGIPAIYRGKQILVAGDEKQLQPNTLYYRRWDEDTEDNIDVEIDSLLALSARHIERLSLRGHYRSKALALMDFSNRKFYNNQLALLPDFDHHMQPTPPIIYKKVEGQWENNVNIIEAQEITHTVIALTTSSPEKDIGIVTFNAAQQMLIIDKLEESFSQKKITPPHSLIVKNIENIQGDEKDIIIFSIGYGINKNGKINMKFGSLNVEGGENRLNVAITRAREKIIIVTSIWPHEMHTENTRNKGPQLLKEYLAYTLQVSEKNFSPTYEMRGTKLKLLLKNKIQEREHNPSWSSPYVIKEIPFADVAMQATMNKTKLLLTDDENYYQSTSPKASHFFTSYWLQNKGWKSIRIYSRNFWKNNKAFFENIDKFIHS